MTERFLACSRADLLLAVGLNDVDLAISDQRSIDEVIEPGFRQLPVSFCAADPFGSSSPPVLKPVAIVVGEW